MYPIPSDPKYSRKSRKRKVSGLLQSPGSSSNALTKIGTNHRLKLTKLFWIEKLKMETSENIRASLIQGEWVFSLDLSDAYLLISIHARSRQFLWFTHKSQIYQFTSTLWASNNLTSLYIDGKRGETYALSLGIRHYPKDHSIQINKQGGTYSLEIQWNLYYPTLYYPNFQLSDLQSTLPTTFKPVILGFPLSDLSIIRPNCYSPKRVG